MHSLVKRFVVFSIIAMQCMHHRFSDAQNFSKHIPTDPISSAEFRILFGDPLVVEGELMLGQSEVVRTFEVGKGLEQGLLPAKLKVSKIVYATPGISENLSLALFEEQRMKSIELDVFLLVRRTIGGQSWSPDWSKQALPKTVVVSRSSLLGFYYIDSMGQGEEAELFDWLEKRVKMLKDWNVDSAERIARNNPNQNP